MSERKIIPILSCDAKDRGPLKANSGVLFMLANGPPILYHTVYLKVKRLKLTEDGRPYRIIPLHKVPLLWLGKLFRHLPGGWRLIRSWFGDYEFETEEFDDYIISFELGYIATEKEAEG